MSSSPKRRKVSYSPQPTIKSRVPERTDHVNCVTILGTCVPKDVLTEIFMYVNEDMQWPFANVCTLLRNIKMTCPRLHIVIRNYHKTFLTHMYEIVGTPINTLNTKELHMRLLCPVDIGSHYLKNFNIDSILNRFPVLEKMYIHFENPYLIPEVRGDDFKYKFNVVSMSNVRDVWLTDDKYYKYIPHTFDDIQNGLLVDAENSKLTVSSSRYCSRCSAVTTVGKTCCKNYKQPGGNIVLSGVGTSASECAICHEILCVHCANDAYRPITGEHSRRASQYICDNCMATAGCELCLTGVYGEGWDGCGCSVRVFPPPRNVVTAPTIQAIKSQIRDLVKKNKDNVLLQYFYLRDTLEDLHYSVDDIQHA